MTVSSSFFPDLEISPLDYGSGKTFDTYKLEGNYIAPSPISRKHLLNFTGVTNSGKTYGHPLISSYALLAEFCYISGLNSEPNTSIQIAEPEGHITYYSLQSLGSGIFPYQFNFLLRPGAALKVIAPSGTTIPSVVFVCSIVDIFNYTLIA
jgi:hypothetical protein